MQTSKLFKISKYAYREVFLKYTMDMAGSNQSRINEKMAKNSKYLKNQGIMMRIVIGVYLLALIFIPIQYFNLLPQGIDQGVPEEWIILSGSIVITSYFVIQTLYMLMLGMFQGSGILNGAFFKWLATLPLNKKDLRKVSFFTFFRAVDTSAIGLIITLPVGVFIATQNISLTLVSLLISIANSLFAFSLLVILSKGINRAINSNEANNTRNNIVRMVWLVMYIAITMTIAVGLQLIIPKLSGFVLEPPANASNANQWNNILSWIPLGLSQSYILVQMRLGASLSSPYLQHALLGLLVFIGISVKMAQLALKSLTNLAYSETKGTSLSAETATLEEVFIDAIEPKEAYFRKDRNMLTRDIQLLMLVMMASLFPSIGLLFTMFGGEAYTGDTAMVLFITYRLMGTGMAIFGLLNVDSAGTTILASLPIVVRNQALSKIKWLYYISPLSLLPPLIFYTIKGQFITYILTFLIIFGMDMIMALSLMLMHTYLFGKMKYKYVLEEIKSEKKVIKWIGLIIIGLIIYIGTLVAYMTLMNVYGIVLTTIYMIAGEVVLLIMLSIIFNRMFPKPPTYEK